MEKNIELLEYRNSLAAGIKAMWDNSIKGWNGESHETSEKSIIDQENNSSHLHLTLAKVDELIAGYCKLSVDHHDTGALYIDLLNVRDEYHGKKIGKKLVLDAVEKTIKLGWPRVDLFTWPGNLKAVPLYKKCGFFWEKRDDATHLINLIPTVLQTELFTDYFDKADWYRDSRREIKVEPDVKTVNNFDIWTYSWEKEGEILEVDFTRRGRGIKRVETNDYLIETFIEDLNLVFGEKYKIVYKIINKSSKELNIKLKGVDDGNIKFDYNSSISVSSEEEITTSFYVDEVKKEQLEWKTHPGVITEMEVNGKKVTFKTGINSRAPITMKVVSDNHRSIGCLRDIGNRYYINLKNHYKKDTTFSFSLPYNNKVKFQPESYSVRLKPGQKKSIPVDVFVEKSSFYVNDIEVSATYDESDYFDFKIQLSEVFCLGYGSYCSESKDSVFAGIGYYFLDLNKSDNTVTFGNFIDSGEIKILPGMLGQPFSGEFEKKNLSSFDYKKGDGWIQLDIKYESEAFKDIELIRSLKLYENGILERWFKVISLTDRYDQDFYVSDRIGIEEVASIIPYNDKIISLNMDDEICLDMWSSDSFSENWIYLYIEESNIGLNWTENHKLNIAERNLALISSIGRLFKGGSGETDVITLSFNTFKEWKTFRDFTLKKKCDTTSLSSGIDLEINNGNPFLNSESRLRLISNNNFDLTGKLEYSLGNNKNSLLIKDEKELEIDIETEKSISIADISFIKESTVRNIKKAIFLKGCNEVELTKEKGVFSVNNGILQFKASSDFAPSLYSLKYMGSEWLDSNYPDLTPKSWWNPWSGGLFGFPEGYSLKSLLEENFTTEFVTKVDNKGNSWSGIKILVDILNNPDKRGFSYSQYYLTLPDLPVLMTFCEFENRGEFLNTTFVYNNFYRGGDRINELSFKYLNKQGNYNVSTAGSDGIAGEAKNELKLYNKSTPEHLIHICGDENYKGYYINQHICMGWFASIVSAKGGDIGRSNPYYLVFSKEEFEDGSFKDFQGLIIE